MSDVIVNITDLTRPTTVAGFGLPLILGVTASITGTKDTYKEYTSTTEVAVDYASTTDEYKAAAALFAQDPSPDKVAIINVTRTTPTAVPADLTDALDDIMAAGKTNWYWLITTSKVVEDIDAVGTWVDANKKLFGVGFNDATLSNITELAAGLASERAFVFAHKTPAEFPEAALIGKLAPKDVGSWTAKFKNLVGVKNPGYTAAEISTLEIGKVFTYTEKMGVLQTTEGMTTAGTFIDVTVAKDWLKTNIETEVMSVLINSDKVPYTDEGITQVVDAVKSVLRKAVVQGMLSDFSVTAPKAADISTTDKTNRTLPDINFTATLAGAIHKVTITGVVQV
jgi:hypothetical protein